MSLTRGRPSTIAPSAPSSPGAAGKSAYELAVAAGYTGTVEDWLASLKGVKGDTGAAGSTGTGGGAFLASYGGADVGDGRSATFSNGTVTGQNVRRRLTMTADVGLGVIRLPNFAVTVSSSDACPTNDFLVTAWWERANGAMIPITFGGQSTVTVRGDAGQKRVHLPESDPFSVNTAAGSYGWIRLFVRGVNVGDVWPLYSGQRGDWGDGATSSSGEVDKSATAGSVGSAAVGAYNVLGLWAINTTRTKPAVAIWGDSVTVGLDSYIAAPLVAGGCAVLNFGRNGDALATFNLPSRWNHRLTATRDVSTVVCDLMVNDLRTAWTASMMQGVITYVIRQARARAQKIIYTTPTPMKQLGATLDDYDAKRREMVAWLRTRPLGIDIWDTAAVAEAAAGDPNCWPAGWSNDGIHPISPGVAGLRPAIDLSLLA